MRKKFILVAVGTHGGTLPRRTVPGFLVIYDSPLLLIRIFAPQ